MTNANKTHQSSDSIDLSEELDTVEYALNAIVRLGRIWAKHGLRVAEQAVKTTSEALVATADTLRETSKRIEKRAPR